MTEHERETGEPTVAGSVAELTARMTFLSHQVSQLSAVVSAQSHQLRESDEKLAEELSRFQTGGPQRAMMGVFTKLFRDLVSYLTELDELVALGETGDRTTEEQAWIDSLRTVRNRFEDLLAEWGSTPIPVRIGVDEFDPAIHESIDGEPSEDTSGLPDNCIVDVKRRGWKLHSEILQHPLVVVN